MLDELREELIVNKVGGRFKLSTLIQKRLVALNAKRAAEEAAGIVRWLRPEFQNPALRGAQAAEQGEMEVEAPEAAALGCVTAIALASFYGEFSLARLWAALMATARTYATLSLVIVGALVLSQAIALTGLPRYLIQMVADAGLSPALDGQRASSPAGRSPMSRTSTGSGADGGFGDLRDPAMIESRRRLRRRRSLSSVGARADRPQLSHYVLLPGFCPRSHAGPG